MTRDEFDTELPVVFAMWNRTVKAGDPLAEQIANVWAKELKTIDLRVFQAAYSKLSSERPERFPTIGMVKRAVAEVEALRLADQVRSEIAAARRGDVDSELTARDYRMMATDLDDQAEEASAPVAEFYRHLASFWRMNAARIERGEKPLRPKLSDLLRETGMLGPKPMTSGPQPGSLSDRAQMQQREMGEDG